MESVEETQQTQQTNLKALAMLSSVVVVDTPERLLEQTILHQLFPVASHRIRHVCEVGRGQALKDGLLQQVPLEADYAAFHRTHRW